MTVAVAPADSAAGEVQGAVVREIDDPECGTRWLLLRDASDRGGPGRMVLIQSANGESKVKAAHAAAPGALVIPKRPVIRAGDLLVIEENTSRVEARLEAVALGPASPGNVFEVRLQIGGKIERAVALAPGRATFAGQIGAQP